MQVHDVMLLCMEELDSFRVVLLMESESSLEVCFIDCLMRGPVEVGQRKSMKLTTMLIDFECERPRLMQL